MSKTTVNYETIWNNMNDTQKSKILVECGFAKMNGKMSKIGMYVLHQKWENLTDTFKNIIKTRLEV